ncbi:MAG: RHS repeat-associated core domain-containing protein [bacterium]
MKNEGNIDFRATTRVAPTKYRHRSTSGVEMSRRLEGVCNTPLQSHNIINMNGRIYDPITAQFMQADNFIQTPEDYIGYNRYAYCRYNPFKYVDPSGEWLEINHNDINNVGETANPIIYYSRSDAIRAEMYAENVEASYASFSLLFSDFSIFGLSNAGTPGGKAKDKSNSKSGTKTSNISNSKSETSDKSSKGKGKDDGSKSFWRMIKMAILSRFPVAIDLEGNVSFLWAAGTSINPIGGILILQGDDAFKVKGFSAGGAGGGAFVAAGAMVSSMYYYYYGDINNFNRKTFKGWSDNATLSFEEGPNGAVSVAWLKDEFGGYLIGVGTGVGVGVSGTALTFQWNHQYTKIWGK